MACYHLLIAFTIIMVLMSGQQANGQLDKKYLNSEHKLHADLLANYEKQIRPVYNQSDSINLKFGVAAVALVELKEKEHAIVLNSWIRMYWKDVRLTWNASDYDGLDHTRIDYNKIWRPDVTLYNSAQPGSIDPHEMTLAVIQNDGTILFIPHVFLEATCAMYVEHFPFDTQYCLFKFGSWTFDGFKLDIDFFDGKANLDLTDYNMNNQWEVIEQSAQKNIKKYPCCEETYPDITFKIKFKRRSLQFMIHGTPALMMALMIPFIFLMPHGTGDKTTLAIGIQLCLLIMMALMQDYFSAFILPILLRFYIYSFILVSVSLVMSLLVNNLFASCTMAPPSVLFKACSCVGCVMCVSASVPKGDTFAMMDVDGSGSPAPTNVRMKWLYIGNVIDRILCVIFLIVVAIMSGSMLGSL